MSSLRRIITLPRSIPAILVFNTLQSKNLVIDDLKRMNMDGSVMSLHKALSDSRTFRSVFRTRVYTESKLKYHLINWTYKPLNSLELNVTTRQIGGGFIIWHGHSTVIYCKSIGKNCSIYQNVTLGRGKKIDGNDIPIIGDNVNIYTGATVIGGVHIGNNVDVGAGAVVVNDVPDNCVVVGVPAKIVKRKN